MTQSLVKIIFPQAALNRDRVQELPSAKPLQLLQPSVPHPWKLPRWALQRADHQPLS